MIELFIIKSIYKIFSNTMNNSNARQNIWDQTALFIQLALCKILKKRYELGTPELRAAMATMLDEKRDDAFVFLECNADELSVLLNGCGIQSIANVRNLLECLPIIEPNIVGNSVRVTHKSVDRVASSLLPKL